MATPASRWVTSNHGSIYKSLPARKKPLTLGSRCQQSFTIFVRTEPCYQGPTCSKEGRALGSRCQHNLMMSDRGGGQLDGTGGRSPFCTTPTAACRGTKHGVL